jgi:hypothetical protein
MKRKTNQQVTCAIVEERHKENIREHQEKAEDDAVHLKELVRSHNEMRHKFRTYIRTMQYDNEVQFTKRLTAEGILW